MVERLKNRDIEPETRQDELQMILEEALGSREVYFHPPSSVSMTYPAIVYKISDIYSRKASNTLYTMLQQYEMVLITFEQDVDLLTRIMMLPMVRFVRSYVSDNLFHYVFNIYY